MSVTVEFYFLCDLNSCIYKCIGSEPYVNKYSQNNIKMQHICAYRMSSKYITSYISDISRKGRKEKSQSGTRIFCGMSPGKINSMLDIFNDSSIAQ